MVQPWPVDGALMLELRGDQERGGMKEGSLDRRWESTKRVLGTGMRREEMERGRRVGNVMVSATSQEDFKRGLGAGDKWGTRHRRMNGGLLQCRRRMARFKPLVSHWC